MIDSAPGSKQLSIVIAVGFALRLFVSVLTPLPREDGANYLWMAERFAEGDFGAALSEVFSPLWPMLMAPAVASGLDPFRAGQLSAALIGALAIWPTVRAAQQIEPRWATAVAWLLALAPLPIRFGAMCLSEPAFHLFGALALWAGLRQRYLLLGLLAGAAFWVRPEGSLLVAGFVLARPKQAWVALLPLAGCVLALSSWRSAYGLPFELVARYGFHQTFRADTGWTSEGLQVGRYALNLLQLLWLWFEAFSLFGVLAAVGLIDGWRRRELRPTLWILLLAALVIAAFFARRRFLVSWYFLLAPLVSIGILRMPQNWRLPAWLVAMVLSLLLSLKLMDGDRYAERVVGEYLAEQLESGEQVVGDMTRVLYFAGMRPLPPHPSDADLIAARADSTDARFVVLLESRPYFSETLERLGDGYREHAMTDEVRRFAERRGILLLERID